MIEGVSGDPINLFSHDGMRKWDILQLRFLIEVLVKVSEYFPIQQIFPMALSLEIALLVLFPVVSFVVNLKKV